MVDLHCHILPEVDDGSSSMEETIEILKKAINAGFDTICFTPHYAEPGYINNKKQNQEVLEKVKEQLNLQNISISLYLGNEVFVTDKMSELYDNGNITTLGDTNYILIEFPMFQELPYTVVKKLINTLLNKDLKVIIAHPERYSYIQKKPEKIVEYFGENVIFQSNYSSILGYHGKHAQKTLKKLLKNKVIHLFATDTHNLSRCCYDQLQEITKKLLKLIDEEYFKVLTEVNPRCIISNKDIKFEK